MLLTLPFPREDRSSALHAEVVLWKQRPHGVLCAQVISLSVAPLILEVDEEVTLRATQKSITQKSGVLGQKSGGSGQ